MIRTKIIPWVYKGKTIFFTESDRLNIDCIYFYSLRTKRFTTYYLKQQVDIYSDDFKLELIPIFVEMIVYYKNYIKYLTDMKDELCTL